MENTELKHILIAYKSTNIGLQQAHDEILRLFNVVGRSEQLLALAQYLHNHSYINKGFKPETLVRRFKGE